MIFVQTMNDFKKIYEYYLTYDKPIPYMAQHLISQKNNLINNFPEFQNLILSKDEIEKLNLLKNQIEEQIKDIDNKALLIYPVNVESYFEFYYSIRCLLQEKNKIPDPKIISMSYLDFLFYLIENAEDGTEIRRMLGGLFKLCCYVEDENFTYYKNNKGKTILVINDIEYDKNDFDNIKKIICYQNMPDYDDSYIDPELEEALNEANNMQTENQGETSLERQLICVSKEYPYKLEELYKIPIRKFVQMLKVADDQLHYKIYKTGECSGMVSFKTPITHYMYTKNHKFDSLISYDSFKDKMKQVT